MDYCIHSPKYKVMQTIFSHYGSNLQCDRDENVSCYFQTKVIEKPPPKRAAHCTYELPPHHCILSSARLFLPHWSPIYGPKCGMLDISVNKTKEDLSRPLFPIVYRCKVLKRQLTFSLAFPICSILVPASPLCFFFCFFYHLLPFPPRSCPESNLFILPPFSGEISCLVLSVN